MASVAVQPHHLYVAAALHQRKVEAMPWRDWLAKHFAAYTTSDYADRHIRFWEWVSALISNPTDRPLPRVEVWPRGGAKSTTVELGCAYLGAQPHPARHFVLYVSETQAQANMHVQAISTMLETAGVGRAVNHYGASRGWTQTMIRTASGFNVRAFGLDAGMRGIKLDQWRPDVIVFDDIDARHDTADTTRKKVETITTSILPAESADCAIIVVQNKIAQDSIVSQLCDGRADFLHDRLPATVEPAVRDLSYERVIEDGRPRYRITGGIATWDGQDIATCERQINAWGLGAFLREAQHEVDEVEGGLWNRARDIDPFRVHDFGLPVMHRVAIGIDPSASSGGDATGIIAAGVSWFWQGRRDDKLHAYVLDDRTMQGSPKAWAEASVALYQMLHADVMVAEANNGGEMVARNIEVVPGAPTVKLVHASRGKITRAEPIQNLYERGRVHHVGVMPNLERQMCTYVPGDPSPDAMDALVWTLTELLIDGAKAATDQSAFAPVEESRESRSRRYRRMQR
jgi:hypothetical protein